MKHFFNEKEVTSTLVMDALYSGCRQVEEAARFLEEVGGLEQRGSGGERMIGTVSSQKLSLLCLPWAAVSAEIVPQLEGPSQFAFALDHLWSRWLPGC